jgi:hypothetical protein
MEFTGRIAPPDKQCAPRRRRPDDPQAVATSAQTGAPQFLERAPITDSRSGPQRSASPGGPGWPCGQHWGPPRDHTSCAMPNDPHVRERHTPRPGSENCWRHGKTRCRYFLGVKWSQVQTLSARPQNMQVRAGFGEIRAAFFCTRRGYGQQPIQQPAHNPSVPISPSTAARAVSSAVWP